MSEDELELPFIHLKGTSGASSTVKLRARDDINPRLYGPTFYARSLIHNLISRRHEIQYELASLPHPEERVLSIYDQTRLLWHMQRMEISLWNYSGLFAIFAHCKRVKQVYVDNGRRLPRWFTKKFRLYL